MTPDELILPELGPKLGAYAQRKLISRCIEIITGARVKATATEDGIELTNGMKIPSRTLIWTAGTAAHSLLTALPVPNDRGRIKVDEFLQVPGLAGLWAVGDCARWFPTRFLADFIRPPASTRDSRRQSGTTTAT